MSAWVYLVVAGIFEVLFAITLKMTENFSKLLPTIGFLVFGAISFYALTKAMQHIPIGTAYAVWTGIGAVGTAILGMILYSEPATLWRLFFIGTLVCSIIGLKLVSN